ncbi:MAG: TetR/AcrR family transcriptional regulator [Melioribacteraceae bacterium]|nr:TetR/AcrR family transcriptional regulator [Melioribacteraceae bacterium]
MKSVSEKYEIKKEQILEAASELLAYYGYEKTTLDDIANKVGVKKNSIYYYFDSKEELINEIITRIFESKVKLFEEKSAAAKNSLEKLKIFISVFVSHKYSEEKTYNITPSAYLEISKVVEKSFEQYVVEAENLIREVLNEGKRKGELRNHNAKEVARIILEFTKALELMTYSNSETKFIDSNLQSELEGKVLQFIELIYHGIKKSN